MTGTHGKHSAQCRACAKGPTGLTSVVWGLRVGEGRAPVTRLTGSSEAHPVLPRLRRGCGGAEREGAPASPPSRPVLCLHRSPPLGLAVPLCPDNSESLPAVALSWAPGPLSPDHPASSQHPGEAGPVILPTVPIFQRRKQRLREVKSLALGHTAGSCRAAWLPPYCLVSECPVMLRFGCGLMGGWDQDEYFAIFFLSLPPPLPSLFLVCYGCSEF